MKVELYWRGFIIWNLIMVMGFFSCTDNNVPYVPGVKGDEVVARFRMAVPFNQLTRSGTLRVDSEVDNIELYSFKVSADGLTETYFYSVSDVTINDTGDENIKEIAATVYVSEEKQRFVLIANAKEVTGALPVPEVTATKQQVLSDLIFAKKTTWNNISANFTPLPMWGESEVYTVTSDADLSAEIQLLRMVSKVDVTVATELADDFSIETIHVYNAGSRGFIAPDPLNLVTVSGQAIYKVEAPTVPGDNDPSDPLKLPSPLEHRVAPDGTVPSIYLFESEMKNAAKEDEVVCLVVGARMDNTLSYYRIDFYLRDDNGNITGYSDLLRNHKYGFAIKEVKGVGQSSPQEAFASPSSPLEVELYVWDQGELTEFAFNSQNVLGLSRKRVEKEAYETEEKLLVTTDYTGGWTAVVEEGADWLEVRSANFTAINTKDELILELAVNDTGLERTGTVLVAAGTLKLKVTVIQFPDSGDVVITGSNAYMLQPSGSSVEIPINWANKDGKTRFRAEDEVQIEYIWSDSDRGIAADGVVRSMEVTGSGFFRKLLVAPGSAVGNAVVGISVDGDLVWSWHLWVTDYDPESGTTYSNNGYTFMDRNLGALDDNYGTAGVIGLYYQWGRKDPFPGTVSSNTSSTELRKIYNRSGTETEIVLDNTIAADNLENSIRNPKTFYGASNWEGTSGLNLTYWKDTSGDKGIYDPCPEGWRIPPTSNSVSLSPWGGLNGTNFNWIAGGLYSTSAILGNWQTGGMRLPSTGDFFQVGIYGYYWTSSTVKAATGNYHPYAFTFSSGGGQVELAEASYSGRGQSVRCVKDY